MYDNEGMPNFALLHSREYDKEVSLCALDLWELQGTEVRRTAALWSKTLLADLLKTGNDGIEFNEHIEGFGQLIFEHACKLVDGGIIPKRKESGKSFR